MNNNDYHLKQQINTINKLYRLTEKLPLFMQEFFLGIESNTAPLTRLNYAMDITIFFDFISFNFVYNIDEFI